MVFARFRTTRTAVLLTALGASLVTPVTGAGAAAADSPRPLTGWAHEQPAPGVDVYQGVLSRQPGASHWTVTLNTGGSHLRSAAQARELAGRLRGAGFSPRTERVTWPRGADRSGLLGVRVRVGEFDSRAQADARLRELAEAGFDAVSEWTGGDGGSRGIRTHVNVAVVDPDDFEGALTTTYGEAVAGRETVTEMAEAEDALLAVNGGYFVMGDEDGVPGAAAGVGAYDGELQSSATNGRIALVVPGDGSGVELRRLHTSSRVTADGASAVLDGVNRRPGLIRNCGGVGGDRPTQRPLHDVTCTDPDEIVQFTDELGGDTPAGPGVEAVLDESGRVTALRPRGGPVPAGGSVLAGTGSGAEWLREHAGAGSRADVRHEITDAHGRELDLGPDDDIVNGGPQLVRDGRVAVTSGAGGFDHPGDPSFAYAWALERHPRTMAGVDDEGRLLLVSASGRHPGYSDGLSLHEAARLMESLGAVRAMNLDGGGSTGMVLDGELLTRPSDAAGERAVGDALLLTDG